MVAHNMKSFHILVIFVLILTISTAAVGLFAHSPQTVTNATNSYGQTMVPYGYGIYSHDDAFKAPIFRGTDLTMLVLVIPATIMVLAKDMKRTSNSRRLFLTSLMGVFLYYAISMSFGVIANALLLVYIALFSASFFALILGIPHVGEGTWKIAVTETMDRKGTRIFLILCGIALVVAWLPDIVVALISRGPLATLGVYTTEITYVLDMAIIAPACLICLNGLSNRKQYVVVVLSLLFTLCITIGIMVPIQSVFQYVDGIVLPLPVILTKVLSFCILAIFAAYFEVRLLRAAGNRRVP